MIASTTFQLDLDLVLVQSGLYLQRFSQKNFFRINGVGIHSFLISKKPVSIQEYNAFCRASGYSLFSPQVNTNAPATQLSWFQAEAYCQWLQQITDMKFRLPTIWEWKYAVDGRIHQEQLEKSSIWEWCEDKKDNRNHYVLKQEGNLLPSNTTQYKQHYQPSNQKASDIGFRVVLSK